ncbi:MAG: hypothetical protein ACREL5_03055 [Gemmatimonadales bacterium]
MRILAGVVIVTGCHRGGGATLARAQVDTLPGGVVRVRNSGPTAWTDTNGWRIVKVAERTFALGSPGAMDHPNFPAPLADGSIVVINQKPLYARRYSATLEPLATFGRDGDGPGEFRSPFPIGNGDSVYIADQHRARLIVYDTSGHFVREAPMPCCAHEGGDLDHRVVALTTAVGLDRDVVIWWDVEQGAAIDSAMPPAGPDPAMIQSCRFVLPFQPQQSVAAVAPGKAWWGISSDDRFVLTRHGDDTILFTSASRPRAPVADSVVDKEFGPNSGLARLCGAIIDQSRIPRIKPAWNYIYADAEGDLWVERSGRDRPSFDVYDLSGRWLGVVPSPFHGGESEWWHGDRIASVDEHDDGSFTLRLYRIDRKEAPR